ncbi:MAG: YaiO family outer rane beta-barrel protein [Gemmatimonadota bacterium]
MRPLIRSAIGLALATSVLPAQQTVADSLWRAGRTTDAIQEYRRFLAASPKDAQANFRLAQSLAWAGKLDSALVYIRIARRTDPQDPDLREAEATFLSWGRQWRAALVRFDSLIAATPDAEAERYRIGRARTLAFRGSLSAAVSAYKRILSESPSNRDAAFGLAQVRAWSGRLEEAAWRLGTLDSLQPGETRVLVLLAQVQTWQGRVTEAERSAARIVETDSAAADVRALRQTLSGQRAGTIQATSWASRDTERNANRWSTFTGRALAFGDWRLSASAGWLVAADPFRTGFREQVEATAAHPIPNGTVSGGIGVRSITPARLRSDDPKPPNRQRVTGQLGVAQRLGAGVTARAGASLSVFDEIASLTPQQLDLSEREVSLEWTGSGNTSVLGGASLLEIRDGNRRWRWNARASKRVVPSLVLGMGAATFGFESRGLRYFSPDRFSTAELTADWSVDRGPWLAAAGVGAGQQQISTGTPQALWRGDLRLLRRQGRNEVELAVIHSNSAAASLVGAYAYTAGGLTFRRRF